MLYYIYKYKYHILISQLSRVRDLRRVGIPLETPSPREFRGPGSRAANLVGVFPKLLSARAVDWHVSPVPLRWRVFKNCFIAVKKSWATIPLLITRVFSRRLKAEKMKKTGDQRTSQNSRARFLAFFEKNFVFAFRFVDLILHLKFLVS